MLTDPRTTVHYDDARHYVLTTGDKFDIITSDPIHPWVKGTATLYSKEYFEVVKEHLNPGGVVTQWVPLYESDPDTIKTELATFFEVFPNGTIWANDINGEGYESVLMGQNGDAAHRSGSDDPPLLGARGGIVARSWHQFGLGVDGDLCRPGAGSAPWLADAHVNTDLDLRLQYMAGMGLNWNNAPAIKQQIANYMRYPAGDVQGLAAS